MNLFEFRQWFESALPWWIPFTLPVVIGIAALIVSCLEENRRKKR